MKIVQVNTVCASASTGKICMALYHLAESSHMSSYIAYGRNLAPQGIKSYKIGTKPDFYCHVLRNFIKGESGFGSSRQTLKFINWLRSVKPDVIHLHNIHGFYLNVELFFDYLKAAQVPVVWTLHDCWPFTGHCAYFSYAQCDKWINGCHSCREHRRAYPYSIFKDNSANSYTRKKAAFSNVPNLTIVTPSKWLNGLVKQSFLKHYPSLVIPNGIDLNIFTPPLKSNTFRSHSPQLILGVANVWDARKGLLYFEALAKELSDDYIIHLVGLNNRQIHHMNRNYPGKVIAESRTANTAELVALYQRADVFVNPTLEDNFPTTNLEALACGTPVITFQTGGSPECITKHCGIVVPQGNTSELLDSIYSIKNHPLITPENCRNQALLYSDQDCFRKYIGLYEELA